MKQWYELLFENYGEKYDSEPFTAGTTGECNFIEEEIGHKKSLKILDIGCGTGRHAIELAKRGYKVTGVDLSESMLKRAEAKSIAAGVQVSFCRGDARALPFSDEFDFAIMLCEGAFSLMETDEMNFQILGNAAKALKKEGKLIFTTLNGLYPLFHSVKDFVDSSSKEGSSQCDRMTFDVMTLRDRSVVTFENDSGESKEIECNERFYLPSEITWMLKSLGFSKVEIFGAKLGNFSRNDTLTTEDFEMLVIACK